MDVAVLVTGVGSGSTGEQVYKALRHGRRAYRIVVANMNPDAAVVAPGAERVALPPARSREYLPALAATANAVGARFIVPGSDPELVRIADGATELARLTPAIPLVNDASTIRLCQDKGATADAIARAGLRAPWTADCGTSAYAREAMARAGVSFPVVIKPRRRGGGSADVYVAQDDSELRLFSELVLRGGGPAVIQEYVGDPGSEFTVGVLHYPDRTLAGSFALRRDLGSLLSLRLRAPNRTGRAELGSHLAVSSGFSQGEVDDFPEVRAAAERVAAAVGSTGPLNVQGRLVGSELVVFEVNPRFSGTEAIRAMAGWNSAEALMDWHLGLRPALETYRPRRCTFLRTVIEYELPASAPHERSALAAPVSAGASGAVAPVE
jgi:carbamoyl-phosphate synthase large subunit